MKATELIAALTALVAKFGDREVWTEGCDCCGISGDVVDSDTKPQVNVGYEPPKNTFCITRGSDE